MCVPCSFSFFVSLADLPFFLFISDCLISGCVQTSQRMPIARVPLVLLGFGDHPLFTVSDDLGGFSFAFASSFISNSSRQFDRFKNGDDHDHPVPFVLFVNSAPASILRLVDNENRAASFALLYRPPAAFTAPRAKFESVRLKGSWPVSRHGIVFLPLIIVHLCLSLTFCNFSPLSFQSIFPCLHFALSLWMCFLLLHAVLSVTLILAPRAPPSSTSAKPSSFLSAKMRRLLLFTPSSLLSLLVHFFGFSPHPHHPQCSFFAFPFPPHRSDAQICPALPPSQESEATGSKDRGEGITLS